MRQNDLRDREMGESYSFMPFAIIFRDYVDIHGINIQYTYLSGDYHSGYAVFRKLFLLFETIRVASRIFLSSFGLFYFDLLKLKFLS